MRHRASRKWSPPRSSRHCPLGPCARARIIVPRFATRNQSKPLCHQMPVRSKRRRNQTRLRRPSHRNLMPFAAPIATATFALVSAERSAPLQTSAAPDGLPPLPAGTVQASEDVSTGVRSARGSRHAAAVRSRTGAESPVHRRRIADASGADAETAYSSCRGSRCRRPGFESDGRPHEQATFTTLVAHV